MDDTVLDVVPLGANVSIISEIAAEFALNGSLNSVFEDTCHEASSAKFYFPELVEFGYDGSFKAEQSKVPSPVISPMMKRMALAAWPTTRPPQRIKVIFGRQNDVKRQKIESEFENGEAHPPTIDFTTSSEQLLTADYALDARSQTCRVPLEAIPVVQKAGMNATAMTTPVITKTSRSFSVPGTPSKKIRQVLVSFEGVEYVETSGVCAHEPYTCAYKKAEIASFAQAKSQLIGRDAMSVQFDRDLESLTAFYRENHSHFASYQLCGHVLKNYGLDNADKRSEINVDLCKVKQYFFICEWCQVACQRKEHFPIHQRTCVARKSKGNNSSFKEGMARSRPVNPYAFVAYWISKSKKDTTVSETDYREQFIARIEFEQQSRKRNPFLHGDQN